MDEIDQFHQMVAANIKIHRKRKGLSQEVLAQLSGVGRQTIHRVETGKNGASASTIRKLAIGLKINIHELTEGLLAE